MGRVTRTQMPLRQTFERGCKELDDKQVAIGWFESARYKDGTPVAYAAAVSEFGSQEQNIPTRSYMRTTMAAKQTEWADEIKGGAIAVVHGKMTGDQVMDSIGNTASGDVRKTISQLTEPPLADSTIAARRNPNRKNKPPTTSTKPLEDSSLLINTLTYSKDKDNT